MNLNSFHHRLDFERATIKSEIPQFRLYQDSNIYYFKGWQRTWTTGSTYELKLSITLLYPDEMPALYVTWPKTLRSYRSLKTLNQLGTRHSTHTLSNEVNGCVKICHSSSQHWDASQTCVGVFTKGILWLEAYENYMQTGKDIAEILDRWKRRQENGYRTR